MNSIKIIENVEKKFREIYSEEPLLIQSPGRINLIGEHTDYNMGFVLPGAIDKAIYYAVSQRSDEIISLCALDMNQTCELQISELKRQENNWPNYLLGVVDQLVQAGYQVKGFNCAFGGDIPIGAGLSSSAAIEAGLAFALNHIFNFGIDKLDLVKLSQKAENEFVGVKCGIMDQFINIFGKKNKVLKIDCRSLEFEYVPFEFTNLSIVLFDTRVSHSLASSEYNQRRKDCGEGVEIINKDFPSVFSLRDVSIEMLKEYKTKLKPIIYNRCKYAVEENTRLLSACDALKENNLNRLGALMYQTHDGLSNDYEVSCEELDYLVDAVRNDSAVYGSRMMGGGFGGCTINLIENDKIDKIVFDISKSYKQKYGRDMKSYITNIGNGTQIINQI
jgi:galactokinase